MNIVLDEFNLYEDKQYLSYINIFISYIKEIYFEDKNYLELLNYLESNEYKQNILTLANRKENKFYIMKIIKDNDLIGFIDYVCYLDEKGKCIIGNFYIYPEYRNKGIGLNVHNIIYNNLKKLGGKFIEITPNEKALSLYKKLGYSFTNKFSEDDNLPIYMINIV